MRRLHSWPSWLLRAVIKYRVPAGLITDAWLELHERARDEADRTVEREHDDITGPWAVAPPKGMH